MGTTTAVMASSASNMAHFVQFWHGAIHARRFATLQKILAPTVRLSLHNSTEPAAPLEVLGLAAVTDHLEQMHRQAESQHFELASAEAPEAASAFSLFLKRNPNKPDCDFVGMVAFRFDASEHISDVQLWLQLAPAEALERLCYPRNQPLQFHPLTFRAQQPAARLSRTVDLPQRLQAAEGYHQLWNSGACRFLTAFMSPDLHIMDVTSATETCSKQELLQGVACMSEHWTTATSQYCTALAPDDDFGFIHWTSEGYPTDNPNASQQLTGINFLCFKGPHLVTVLALRSLMPWESAGNHVPPNILANDQALTHGSRLTCGDHTFQLQGDGNAVLLSYGHVRWATGTHGPNNQATRMIMQGDGNLVMYNAEGRPVWASHTWRKGQPPFQLSLSASGQLAITDLSGHATWTMK